MRRLHRGQDARGAVPPVAGAEAECESEENARNPAGLLSFFRLRRIQRSPKQRCHMEILFRYRPSNEKAPHFFCVILSS